MSVLKKRIVYYIILLFVGLVFICFGLFKGGDNILVSMGFAYVAMAIVRITMYYKINKDDARKKAFEIAQTEERVVFVANKARSFMFAITLYIEFFAAIIFYMIDNVQMGQILFYILGAQSLGYLILFKHYNKKY